MSLLIFQQFLAEAIGIGHDNELVPVAVKMANSPMDRDNLSTLMAEIKIMFYIGKHLNVVNLVSISPISFFGDSYKKLDPFHVKRSSLNKSVHKIDWCLTLAWSLYRKSQIKT